MMGVLADRTYRHLVFAQVIALIGTGLATVALGLLAYRLAGPLAGAVLGGALAIKMIAYIGVGPFVNALVDRFPRRPSRCRVMPAYGFWPRRTKAAPIW